MLKKIFLLLLIIFITINIYSNKIQQPLTADYLYETLWNPEYSIGVEIDFINADGQDQYYKAWVNHGMDGYEKSGFFYIKNNKLDLYIADSNDLFLKGGKLIYDDNAVKYSLYIIFDDGTIIYDKNSEVKDGTEIKIDGYDAVTVSRKEAGLEYNMKFRNAPSLDGEIIKIWYIPANADGPDPVQLSYVPKDIEIKVIARTKRKHKVKNWNNYWYYVEVPDEFCLSYQKGWMFGEFIIFQ